MKTVVTKRILANVQDVQFGYWDNEAEEFIPITDDTVMGDAASRLKCSPELIEAILFLVEHLTSSIHADLTDIWKRLDAG